MSEGVKYDNEKDPWHLAPWDAFRAIVKVLAFGSKKYEARNWEKGMAWSRPFSALQRHLTAWWEGDSTDPETGFSHLWHAGCCIVFLISYEIRGVGQDDRPYISGITGND
ncbi:MAG TPA: dATP/dGTP diphosphohydrolase domain-containing protein [Mariprofundaceae bacterium]|nr:dATP/dGTP diphosphohydrolase domain-containing protein [Mariprofundaceae bacterium]